MHRKDQSPRPQPPDWQEPSIHDFYSLELIDRRVFDQWYRTQRRMQARWPRLCRCGREFRGPRAQSLLCPQCREAAKADGTYRRLQAQARAEAYRRELEREGP